MQNSSEVALNDIPEASEKGAPKTNVTKEEKKISKCVIGDFFLIIYINNLII